MSTVVLAIAAAAAVACPAHMLWQMRRGRGATCGSASSRNHGIAALRTRQRELEALIADRTAQNGGDEQSYGHVVRG